MNGYTSGLRVGANHDPEPWVNPATGKRKRYSIWEGFIYDPRAEYVVPVNGLLAYVRQVGRSWESTAELAHSMLVTIRIHDAALKRDRDSWIARLGYTPDEIEHARRVLTRLVALS
jgi:hypothetical protein